MFFLFYALIAEFRYTINAIRRITQHWPVIITKSHSTAERYAYDSSFLLVTSGIDFIIFWLLNLYRVRHIKKQGWRAEFKILHSRLKYISSIRYFERKIGAWCFHCISFVYIQILARDNSITVFFCYRNKSHSKSKKYITCRNNMIVFHSCCVNSNGNDVSD